MADEHNDEIDLTELMVKMRNVLVRNTILITILIVSGLVLGYVYYQLKPFIYQSTIVIQSKILDEPLLKVINENLTRRIEERNYNALSTTLNVSPEIAENIRTISIEPAAEDNKAPMSFYLITVEAASNGHWNALKHGVVGYLANNAYVEKRINLQKERYRNLMGKLDTEIRQLDSLKMQLSSPEESGNNQFVVMNPSDVYSTLISLHKQRQQYKEELELNTAVEVVENFEAYQQPISPRLVRSMGLGALIGLLLSFFIIIAREINAYINKYESDHIPPAIKES